MNCTNRMYIAMKTQHTSISKHNYWVHNLYHMFGEGRSHINGVPCSCSSLLQVTARSQGVWPLTRDRERRREQRGTTGTEESDEGEMISAIINYKKPYATY